MPKLDHVPLMSLELGLQKKSRNGWKNCNAVGGNLMVIFGRSIEDQNA